MSRRIRPPKCCVQGPDGYSRPGQRVSAKSTRRSFRGIAVRLDAVAESVALQGVSLQRGPLDDGLQLRLGVADERIAGLGPTSQALPAQLDALG
jgi:hypothetical protein